MRCVWLIFIEWVLSNRFTFRGDKMDISLMTGIDSFPLPHAFRSKIFLFRVWELSEADFLQSLQQGVWRLKQLLKSSESDFLFRGKHYSETKCMFKFFFIKSNLSTVRGLVKISAHWWSVSMNWISKTPFWT